MTSPSQKSLPTQQKHQNRGLFSVHYLDEILPTLREWESIALFTEVKQVRDELRELFDNLQPETLDERQLQNRWFQPVLEKLGHFWQEEIKIRYREQGNRRADYAFAATAEAANALTNQIYRPDELKQILAIGEAKIWGRNLDQSGGSDKRNPSQQIDEYLRYSEIKWGILSDGRYWRLYERSSSKDNIYYAVDIETLLHQGSVEDFYYFYLFFRREAFVENGWLDRVLQGSIDYAEKLSDQLEDEVYLALEIIAQGFLNFRRNRLESTPESLKLIYEQSLILLYRLLFIFYAESLNILPMIENRLFRDHQSLRAVTALAIRNLENPTELKRRVDRSELYAVLRALFFTIDSGSPEYNVSPYNGRLFSDEEYPFLATKEIGDTYLAQALDRLARIAATSRPSERSPARVLVDYRDLSVRHLGAIYEKLLEYQLDVATVPLTTRRKNKVEIYEPAEPNDAVVKQPGEVFLRTGNNERKITGSYYTPDYIVTFIVQQTIEPLLIEITQQYASLDAEGNWTVHDREALTQAILSLNILDPATGSGHFLVEVVAQIAKWLTDLNLRPEDIEGIEDELTYWKRQIVTACVYGVDVNPLSVELAKLSLWLTTIGRDKPLSFLDHHIRAGNTLVGARTSEISASLEANEPTETVDGQLLMFDEAAFTGTVGEAVGKMASIEQTIALAVTDVKEQEKSFAQIFDALIPWRSLAHVWTARHFGLKLTQEQWKRLYDHTVGEKNGTALPADLQAILDAAQELHTEHRFFHWDLAFPEVFFDEMGKPLPDAGFDAVVGNPPYVRQERITPYKDYFKMNYAVHKGTADLFLYFYEQAFNLVKPSQRVGYITSGTYMNSNSATPFRKYIHQNAAFEKVVNFGENQPFKGAEMVYPTMAILRKGKAAPTFQSLFVEDVYRRQELGNAIEMLPMDETLSDVTSLPEWRFQSVELTRLFQKITDGYTTLGDVVKGKIYYGIKTGLNEAFIIDAPTRQRLIEEHPSSAEIIKPMLRGQDLRPWYQEDSGLHLIFAFQGIEIEKYPAIRNHLERFRQHLELKPREWDEKKQGNWNGRATGNYQWYELQSTAAYHEAFEGNKICWSDISKLPRFSWNNGSYFNNTVYTIPLADAYLLGLLQSRVLWFALSQIATPLRLRAGLWQYRLFTQYMERLPIPDLNPSQEAQLAETAEQITALAKQRYQLHESMRHRIQSDLSEDGKLNTKLRDWWELPDFDAFQNETKKAFQRNIPLSERDEWEAYLGDQQAKHRDLTEQIIQHEITLNRVVYDAFRLTPEEIALIEQATKYPYGAV